jgi:hypothetical protein
MLNRVHIGMTYSVATGYTTLYVNGSATSLSYQDQCFDNPSTIGVATQPYIGRCVHHVAYHQFLWDTCIRGREN